MMQPPSNPPAYHLFGSAGAGRRRGRRGRCRQGPPPPSPSTVHSPTARHTFLRSTSNYHLSGGGVCGVRLVCSLAIPFSHQPSAPLPLAAHTGRRRAGCAENARQKRSYKADSRRRPGRRRRRPSSNSAGAARPARAIARCVVFPY